MTWFEEYRGAPLAGLVRYQGINRTSVDWIRLGVLGELDWIRVFLPTASLVLTVGSEFCVTSGWGD